MIGIMDLNVLPQPEEDDETFEQHFEEYNAPERHTEHKHHVEHVESAVDIARRVLHSIFYIELCAFSFNTHAYLLYSFLFCFMLFVFKCTCSQQNIYSLVKNLLSF